MNNNNNLTKIAKELKDYRKFIGINGDIAAKEIGISPGLLSRLERGITEKIDNKEKRKKFFKYHLKVKKLAKEKFING